MHKLILWFFENLNNIGQFFSLVCSFLIMTTLFYWLENILHAQWNWLNFIKPFLDTILNFSDSILPFSITAFGTVFEGKFISTVLILLLTVIILRFLINCLEKSQNVYENIHVTHKKFVENNFNKNLAKQAISSEIKTSKYMVFINTKLKTNQNLKTNTIDINEENKKMNKFFSEKTGAKLELFNNGFLYNFDNFNKIDDVLEVLFFMLKSESALNYSVCIQLGYDFKNLKKIIDLNIYGKIIICGDSVFKYENNKIKKFKTQCIGVYQKDNGTLEIYEFCENI